MTKTHPFHDAAAQLALPITYTTTRPPFFGRVGTNVARTGYYAAENQIQKGHATQGSANVPQIRTLAAQVLERRVVLRP